MASSSADAGLVSGRLAQAVRLDYRWALALITAVSGMARVLMLGVPPLWRDEAFTAVVVRRSWLDMLDVVRHDSAPPLSYLLAKAATLVSASPLALRLVSALCGVVAVLLVGALGRRLGGDAAGLTSAALIAVLPFYAVEWVDARMYALATTFVLGSTLALLRAVERPGLGHLGLYGACVTLGLYSLYFTLIVVALQLVVAAFVLRPGRATMIKVLGAAAAGFLALVPWLIAAQAQFQHVGAPFWVEPLSPTEGLTFLTQLLAGPQVLRFGPPGLLLLGLQGLALGTSLALVAGVGVLAMIRGRPRPALRFLVLACLGALAVLVVISIRRPLLDVRYGAPLLSPLVAVAGAGLVLLRPRWLAIATIGLFAAPAVALSLDRQIPDIPALVVRLDGNLRADDLVALSGPHEYFPMSYYARPELMKHVRVVGTELNWYDGTAAYPPGLVLPSLPATTTRRIHVITDFGIPQARLPAGYSRRARHCFTGVCLETFSR